MKNLIIIMLVFTVFMACGSASTTPGITDNGVTITCMDMNYTADEVCNGTQEPQNKPLTASASLEPSAITYDVGTIATGTSIWAQAEVTNKSASQADVYFYTEFNKDGIFSNNTAQTIGMACDPGDTLGAQYGSNPCPDPGPCAQAGYWEYVTYVYNASHLAEGEFGDPSIDELLAVGMLKFTLEAQ